LTPKGKAKNNSNSSSNVISTLNSGVTATVTSDKTLLDQALSIVDEVVTRPVREPSPILSSSTVTTTSNKNNTSNKLSVNTSESVESEADPSPAGVFLREMKNKEHVPFSSVKYNSDSQDQDESNSDVSFFLQLRSSTKSTTFASQRATVKLLLSQLLEKARLRLHELGILQMQEKELLSGTVNNMKKEISDQSSQQSDHDNNSDLDLKLLTQTADEALSSNTQKGEDLQISTALKRVKSLSDQFSQDSLFLEKLKLIRMAAGNSDYSSSSSTLPGSTNIFLSTELSDPFKKVKDLISRQIKRLQKSLAEDASKKTFFTSEMAKSRLEKKRIDEKLLALNQNYKELDLELKEITAKITETGRENKEAGKEVVELEILKDLTGKAEGSDSGAVGLAEKTRKLLEEEVLQKLQRHYWELLGKVEAWSMDLYGEKILSDKFKPGNTNSIKSDSDASQSLTKSKDLSQGVPSKIPESVFDKKKSNKLGSLNLEQTSIIPTFEDMMVEEKDEEARKKVSKTQTGENGALSEVKSMLYTETNSYTPGLTEKSEDNSSLINASTTNSYTPGLTLKVDDFDSTNYGINNNPVSPTVAKKLEKHLALLQESESELISGPGDTSEADYQSALNTNKNLEGEMGDLMKTATELVSFLQIRSSSLDNSQSDFAESDSQFIAETELVDRENAELKRAEEKCYFKIGFQGVPSSTEPCCLTRISGSEYNERVSSSNSNSSDSLGFSTNGQCPKTPQEAHALIQIQQLNKPLNLPTPSTLDDLGCALSTWRQATQAVQHTLQDLNLKLYQVRQAQQLSLLQSQQQITNAKLKQQTLITQKSKLELRYQKTKREFEMVRADREQTLKQHGMNMKYVGELVAGMNVKIPSLAEKRKKVGREVEGLEKALELLTDEY